ncbi:MAG TPA: hypothetical protein RMH99_26525 [Sandaracinaceae bacterium LLY-WYZ-13_1]|nr:hypothetical protein [Sandaracinaceae bacterium LLY-WYZ-13_1]
MPRWAVVDDVAIDALEGELDDGEEGLQETLDQSYREMDRLQPELAAWLAGQVSSRQDELAQSVGYFLAVTVYMAFREAFPTRLSNVDEAGLRLAIDTLEADSELRANDPTEVFESDDVVAMGQPAVVSYVQHHFDEAIAQADGAADLDAFDAVYQAILVEIIALSHAVRAPDGQRHRPVLA